MPRTAPVKNLRQNGVALLVFVIILALAAIALMLREMSISDMHYEQNVSTSRALSRAKQALLSYSVTYVDNNPGEFGFLPCPDASASAGTEGDSDGSCGVKNANSLGLFPWGTLETGALKSSSGDCLWYAVSGNYKNVNALTKTDMLNEDTNGWFQIYESGGTLIQGVQPEDRIVAVIIDPSTALAGQDRVFDDTSLCGLNDDATQFLEGDGIIDNSSIAGTGDTVDAFIMAGAGTDQRDPPFNDRMVTITLDEIWQAVLARNTFNTMMVNLTEALAMCLSDYAASNTYNRLPWPAPIALADYRDSDNYNDNVDATAGYAGRYPFIVDNSNSDIPGANVSSELFTEAGCSALVTTSGASVDLQTANSEYRKLWENWKDHFFYAVSRDYAPGNTAAVCSANCITVNGPRAAMVVYAGSRQAGQLRDGPVGGDADTKFNVANYMENGNEAVYPDTGGDGVYSTAGTNDVMFCLTPATPPAVVAC